MVAQVPKPVKAPRPRFAPPPWDTDTPQWQDIDQRLPDDHPARIIHDAVQHLDLSELFASYLGTGSEAYRPDLMLKIVLYELYTGEQSPTRWARHLRFHDELKWLGLGIQPSRSRLFDFRDRLGPLLNTFHQQVVHRAIALGMTTASRAALDGSALPAPASRYRLLNRSTLEKRLGQLAEAIARDQLGQALERRPGWMAKTPRGRLRQQARFQAAEEQLHGRLLENARRPASQRRDPDRIVVSTSDVQAALGLDKSKVYRPLYNLQLAYDLDSELILGYALFAQPTDAGTLGPMLETVVDLVGHRPEVLLADATYANIVDTTICDRSGVVLYAPFQENDYRTARPEAQPGKLIPKDQFRWDAERQNYRCPEGQELGYVSSRTERRAGGQEVVLDVYRCPGEHCQACPRRAACTRNPGAGRTVSRARGEEVIEALRERMRTAAGKALYKRRRQTVERGFADLKAHRRLERLRCRGLERARTQVGLNILVHNLVVVTQHALMAKPPRIAC
jgi:transposase